MNWDAIGAIGEIVGSLAVVITIAYLAVQTRHNTRSARSASTNQSRAAVTDVLSAITTDSEAVKIYTQGMVDPDSLERHERVRFDLIIYQTLRVIETLFIEYQEGMVSEEAWMGQWRGEQSILKTKGGRESWGRQKKFVSTSFMAWVDDHIDD